MDTQLSMRLALLGLATEQAKLVHGLDVVLAARRMERYVLTGGHVPTDVETSAQPE